MAGHEPLPAEHPMMKDWKAYQEKHGKHDDGWTPIITTFHVIRHKATGKFLPETKSRTRGGYTFTEPMSVEEAQPRLFRTKGAATQALQRWVQGHYYMEYEKKEGYDPNNFFEAEPSGKMMHHPIEGRYFDDFDIIPVYLVEIRR